MPVIDDFEPREGDSILFEEGDRVTIGTAETNDFVYDRGELVFDQGDSGIGFIEGANISGDLGLNEYQINAGVEAEANEDAPVYEGDRSLKLTRSGNQPQLISQPGDGLPYYPEPGDRWRYLAIMLDSGGGNRVRPVNHFGTQSYSVSDGGYVLFYNYGPDELVLRKYDSTGSIDIEIRTSVSLSLNTWHEYEVYWGDPIEGRVFSTSGSELAKVSFSDNEWGAAGVGWAIGRGQDTGKIAMDNARTV